MPLTFRSCPSSPSSTSCRPSSSPASVGPGRPHTASRPHRSRVRAQLTPRPFLPPPTFQVLLLVQHVVVFNHFAEIWYPFDEVGMRPGAGEYPDECPCARTASSSSPLSSFYPTCVSRMFSSCPSPGHLLLHPRGLAGAVHAVHFALGQRQHASDLGEQWCECSYQRLCCARWRPPRQPPARHPPLYVWPVDWMQELARQLT